MDGITGIYGDKENLTYKIWLAISTIQHRGSGVSGIATGGRKGIDIHKRLENPIKLVSRSIFNAYNKLEPIAAIGNVGSAKKKKPTREEAEPLEIFPKFEKDTKYQVVLTLDGYLVEKEKLQREVVEDYRLETTNITEIVGALFHKYLLETNNEFEAGKKLVDKLHGKGSFAISGLIHNGKETKLFAINDDRAFEPFGYDNGAAQRMNKGIEDVLIIGSESVTSQIFKKKFKDFSGAEMLVSSENGVEVKRLREEKLMRDYFYTIYWGTTASKFLGKSITEIRIDLAKYANEYYNSIGKPSQAEIVIPNKDSGTSFSTGLAKALGVELVDGLIKSQGALRTFDIEDEYLKNIAVLVKFIADEYYLQGIKYIATGDDSTVKASIGEGVEGVEMPLIGGAVNVLKISNPEAFIEYWVSYCPMSFPSFKEFHRIPDTQYKCITELGLYKAFRKENMSLDERLRAPFGKSLEEINKAMAARLNVGEFRYNIITNLMKAVGKEIFDGCCIMAVDGKYPIDDKFIPDIIKKQQDLSVKYGIAPELYH